MQRGLAILAGLLLAAAVPAATFDLRERGRLEVFAAGDWKITGEDLGDRVEILIAPTREANAAARLVVNLTEKDEHRTKALLRARVLELCQPIAVEHGVRKPTAEEFYSRQGFGFHCSFTDPELVGKPPEKGNYKHVTYGVVRLAPRVYVAVTILADDFNGPSYQALLGAVEGMELHPR